MINRNNAGAIGLLLVAVILFCFPVSRADIYPAGDANGDGTANVSDAVYIINYIFLGGPEPVNFSAADVFYDCAINISDAVRIIGYVFDSNIDHLDKGCEHSEITGVCVSYLDKYSEPDTNYIVIEVLGNDLYIHNMHAVYNCGLEYNMDYSFNGDVITAAEYDTGEPADCYCYFDHLQSVYYDLENGTYTLIVIGISYEPGEGDTLAVETIVVDDGYGLIGYWDSGCLPENPDKFAPAGINYLYDNGILTMEHDSAVFNCGARMIVAFEQAADTLRFFEINISSDYAYCICPFDMTASVAGIMPGTYVAEIWAIEPLDQPPILTDRRTLALE
jgi:hypothetical protein